MIGSQRHQQITEGNKLLREITDACVAQRKKRRLLVAAEGVIGGAGFVLLAFAAGWQLALAFFLIAWAANIRALREKL